MLDIQIVAANYLHQLQELVAKFSWLTVYFFFLFNSYLYCAVGNNNRQILTDLVLN